MKKYIVGGYVRDRLLGLEGKDRDWVVVGATPQQMESLGYLLVGKDFPVFLHPESKEEYALARTERKIGPGYRGFQVTASPEVTLEQDLARRDLTINAIAQDEQGNIIDPFGGQDDIRNRLLRHVSDAFSEDPVRILRLARLAARFAGLGFQVHDDTLQLMRNMVNAGEVDALVAERVWAEMEKALETDRPDVFFQVLRASGALKRLIPELDRLFGVPQPLMHHPEIDCGIHTLRVLQQAVELSNDGTVRFAALTHDLGKGETDPDIWPKHHDHERRSVELVELLCRRMKIPKRYQELAVLVARYHGTCHKALELTPKTLVKMLTALDVWRRPQRLSQFLSACEADSRGRAGFEQREYLPAKVVAACYEACTNIDVAALRAEGFQGVQLGARIHKERLQRTADTLKRYA